MKYHVQETIGGWRQMSCFEGTKEECNAFLEERCFNGNYAIVSDDDYEVDWL